MLPDSFPPWSTVFSRFRRWRLAGTLRGAHDVLRRLVRQRADRAAETTAAVIDSQSAKTTGVGGPARGYDGGKRVNGRKRHVLVDVMGLVLAVCVHAADVQDRAGARLVVESTAPVELGRSGSRGRSRATPVRWPTGCTRPAAGDSRSSGTRTASSGPGACVPLAAATLGGRAHVRLARAGAPAEQGLRAAARHERSDDLRRHDSPHAPPTRTRSILSARRTRVAGGSRVPVPRGAARGLRARRSRAERSTAHAAARRRSWRRG